MSRTKGLEQAESAYQMNKGLTASQLLKIDAGEIIRVIMRRIVLGLQTDFSIMSI